MKEEWLPQRLLAEKPRVNQVLSMCINFIISAASLKEVHLEVIYVG